MHLFNIAMLAKQVWRLHAAPNSLLNQCLKAKYYPSNDILNAQIGFNPSYTWRSIHHAIETIKKGSCWKIGAGDKVNIWKDNWIPFQNGFKILTPKAGNNINLVNELILEEPSRCWNTNLIDSIFLPFEGDLIKQIPLTHDHHADQLMWPSSKEGIYTVKSGYNLLKNWQDNSQIGSTNPNPLNQEWKKLWALPTIPRHKALLWRIINNAIPTRSNLSHRGIHCSILCPRCMQKEETINHLFMECDRARIIWFRSKLGITFNTNHRNFVDWLLYCFTTLKDKELCYLASVTYEIWFARNLHVFENRDMDDTKILEKAYTTIMDYQKATQNEISHMQSDNRYRINSRSNNNHTRTQHASHKWKKPLHGEIKGNCDANLNIEGMWGIGAIFLDRDGRALAYATWQLPGFNDPKTAEAGALYLMIKLAAECCFTSVWNLKAIAFPSSRV
jgi:hypothetical protein